MKKISFLVFAIFLSFLSVSCGDADPKPTTSGDENEVSDDEGVEDGDDVQNDEENVTEPDDETVVDEEIVTDDEPVEEPDETEEPDENQEPTNPGFDVIGTFNLSYTGQVNASVDMQSRGGHGAAEFVYNGQPITFNEINIGIDIFPLAMVNSGNIVIVWLDNFGLGDLQGTSEKQVFGISVPQNTEAGSGNLASANMYAFYGDMTVNIMGGQFEIKCVRTVTNIGTYEITENTGNSLTMTANGDLLDPAAGAAYLPYPACE